MYGVESEVSDPQGTKHKITAAYASIDPAIPCRANDLKTYSQRALFKLLPNDLASLEAHLANESKVLCIAVGSGQFLRFTY